MIQSDAPTLVATPIFSNLITLSAILWLSTNYGVKKYGQSKFISVECRRHGALGFLILVSAFWFSTHHLLSDSETCTEDKQQSLIICEAANGWPKTNSTTQTWLLCHSKSHDMAKNQVTRYRSTRFPRPIWPSTKHIETGFKTMPQLNFHFTQLVSWEFPIFKWLPPNQLTTILLMLCESSSRIDLFKSLFAGEPHKV